MATYVTRISDWLGSRTMVDMICREVETIKGLTVYRSPQIADTLIRWELSEFDPYFVHEDF